MSSKPGPDRPASLALRLTIWYASAAFLLVLLGSGYLYWGLTENLDREDEQFLLTRMNELRSRLNHTPIDWAEVRQEIESTSTNPGSARLLIRVVPGGDPQQSFASAGMNRLLPLEMLPSPQRRGQDFLGSTTDAEGHEYLTLVYESETPRYGVQIAMDTSQDEVLLGEYRRQLAYVLGGSLLAATIGGYRIARRGLRPVADIATTARRIGPSHLGERITTTGLPAEVRDLADTFNSMLDRLQDAFARLGRFTADIAHELRTPINNLRGEIEVSLARPRNTPEYQEVLGSCLEESHRLTRLIDSLLFLARAEHPETALIRSPMELRPELEAVQEFFLPAASDAGIKLTIEAERGLVILGERQLIQRALGNLVGNALAHTPSGGTVTLFAFQDGRIIRLGVRDTGSGIPAEHIPHIFDRFYRGTAPRSQDRVGLGLAIVKGIIELHGGSAQATSLPGQGTTITLSIPRHPATGSDTNR